MTYKHIPISRILIVVIVLSLLVFAGCSSPVSDKGNDPQSNNDPFTSDTVQYDDNTVLFAVQGRANKEYTYEVDYYNYKGELLKSELPGNVGFYAKNGLANAKDPVSGLIGFVDKDGVFVIDPQWDYAAAFSDDGIALVVSDDKYGYVNERGEEISPCIFDIATSFYKGGVAIVGNRINADSGSYSYEYGVIDKSGKLIVDIQYESITHILSNYILCESNNVHEIYDLAGNMLYRENKEELSDPCYYRFQNVANYVYRYTMEPEGDGVAAITKSEKFNGTAFVEFESPRKWYLERRHVATTSKGIAYGVVYNEETVIPFEYDRIILSGSYIVGLKSKHPNQEFQLFGEQIIDIYNQNFELTAEGLEYTYNYMRSEFFGANITLPDGYFSVIRIDEESGNHHYGIIDYTGKEIVPVEYCYDVRLYTYEGIGGKFELPLW